MYSGDDLLGKLEELQKRFQEEDMEGSYSTSMRRTFLDSELQAMDILNSKPAIFAAHDAVRRRTFSRMQDFVTTGSQWLRDTLEPSTSISISTERIFVHMEKRPAVHFKEEKNRLFRNNFSYTTGLLLPEDFYVGYETVNNDGQHVLLQVESYKDLQIIYNNSTSIVINAPVVLEHESIANCHLFGAKIGSGSWKANSDKLIRINFTHIYNDKKLRLSNVTCVWWNLSEDQWSTPGCFLNATSQLHSVCYCDHLTNYAVIMIIYGDISRTSAAQWQENADLELISEICGIASIICLALTIVGYCILIRERKQIRRNDSVKTDLATINLCLCLCLLLFHCFFVPNVSGETSEALCNAITFFRHYFLMATFTWNAVWAVMLYTRIILVASKLIPTLKMLLIAGYVLPLCLVLLVFVTSFFLDQYSMKKVCWLAPGFAAWSFICTFSCIMIVNLAVYANVIYKIYFSASTFEMRIQSSNANAIIKLRGSFAMFFNLGLDWSIG